MIDQAPATELPYRSGACERDCGRQARRPIYSGHYAFLVNNRPLFCDQCIAEMEAEDAAEREAKENAARRERFETRIRPSGLPKAHRTLRLDDALAKANPPHPKAVGDAMWNWVRHGRGLMLTGTVGAGKTMLAGAAALEVLWQDRALKWASSWTVSRLGGLDELLGPWALVLDDLDKVRDTEFGREVVFEAVDWALEQQLPLLVTTNLGPDAIGERYGDKVASRLVGYCTAVRMTGPDRRLGGAN